MCFRKPCLYKQNKELQKISNTIVSIYIHKQIKEDTKEPASAYLAIINHQGVRFVVKENFTFENKKCFYFLEKPIFLQYELDRLSSPIMEPSMFYL